MEFDLGSLSGAIDGDFIVLFSVRVHWTGRQYAANGIGAVSGMLLIMKGLVRRNPDKRGPCNAYQG